MTNNNEFPKEIFLTRESDNPNDVKVWGMEVYNSTHFTRTDTINQWQDISTAPKDGVYDVIVENKYRLTDIKFKDGEWLDRVLDFDNDFSHYEKVENVTHWMPRPTPPEN